MLPVKSFLRRAFVLGAVLASAAALHAAVQLPAIISDRMVLQRAGKVPVWGWANPGEAVSVVLDSARASTKADGKGEWKVELDLSALGQGPYEMKISGENEITVKDVVIGQVWLASGQSNMEWRLRNSIGADKELAQGAGKFVREFKVAKTTATTPAKNVKGEWVIAEPGKAGNFSAVGYFFAKKLHEELKQPIGVIDSSWGGTPSEAWTSATALATDKALKKALDKRNADIESYPKRKAEFDAKFSQWLREQKLEDSAFAPAEDFIGEGVDTSKWTSIGFGSEIKGKDLPAQGVIWLRRTVNVPKGAAGKNLNYQVQQGRGFFTFYWNGQRFAGPQTWTEAELSKLKGQGSDMYHKIPGDIVKEGANEMAVRIYSPVEVPGRIGWRNSVSGSGGFNMGLGSGWKAKAEKTFDTDAKVLATAPKPVTSPERNQNQPARLFNGMIAPLVPYRLAGVIWYQGESNANRAWQYRTAFPLMIEDWRKQWGEPNLPFYFCQLANYMAKTDKPGESGWAELREAQTYTLKLPNTGQAVLIDLGEAEDIHPRNKTDVGNRLALLALANDYGRSDLVAVGPTYEDKAIVGDKVYLKFKDEGKGSELVAGELPKTYPLKTLNNTSKKLELPSADSQLQGFMICGADKKWVWAQARIEGKHSVAVWSDQVKEPVAVRYAWANNPTCNLYNAAGLPAVPFRTDDFPATTLSRSY